MRIFTAKGPMIMSVIAMRRPWDMIIDSFSLMIIFIKNKMQKKNRLSKGKSFATASKMVSKLLGV